MNADFFINGSSVPSALDARIPVLNPSTGEVFTEIGRGGQAEVDHAVASARSALKGEWGGKSAYERGRILLSMARLLRENIDAMTELEVNDVGKPVSQSRADVIACARYFEFYGEAADKVGSETIPFQNGYTVLTKREPHGVTAHIVPWNYPMQIAGRSVAAALATGNACVIKPAEDASLTTLYMARLAIEAGFPKGVFNVVTGYGAEAGAALATHDDIDHISFTGSNAVGSFIQEAAARRTIRVTLELGGKSPQIVLADADLDRALPFLVKAIIQNSGQTCSAGSRVILEDSIYQTVIDRIAEGFRKLRVGPASADLDLGPLINAKQRANVEAKIEAAIADGVKVLHRADLPDDLPKGGFYTAPTVFGDVPVDHPVAQQEVFGPVLSVIRVRDEDEALEVANATPYGLVAGVWTRDGSKAMRLANSIHAGQVFVNDYGAAGGVELPFGGVKRSGHGREKGLEAMNEFTTMKTVAIRHG